MITVLTGDNSFELTRALDAIVAAFDGTAEKFEGSDLQLAQLPDLLMGATLFADKRLVVVKNLSENKSLWDTLSEWLERVGDDTHLVLVEPKPDKRTKTFKDLKRFADVKEFTSWGDRDVMLAEKWVIKKFGEITPVKGVTFSAEMARMLVARVGVDQWQLYHALEKLAVLDEVTPQVIEQIIEAAPSENVFNLFEAALRGDTGKVSAMIKDLERTQDPFMTFGLLSGQAFQLAALATTDKTSADVAKDIGAHPYALGKLAPHAIRVGAGGARKIVKHFADADSAMKSSATDPWILVEQALIKTTVAIRVNR